MEGGSGIRGNLLDPAAQEFYPTAQFALAYPQIYHTYPPQPPPAATFPSPPESVATRAVALSVASRHVAESAVRAEMEAFGGVRAVEMGSLEREGIVTVHFYDPRSAAAAVAVASGGGGNWAQFSSREVEGPNQGSIVVFNWDPAVASPALCEIFQAFGDVKEITEMSSTQRLVEFYDTRDAARALTELNGKEIFGRSLVIDFARFGGRPKRPNPSYYKRGSSHHQNSPLPPRLTGRWSQSHHHPSTSSTLPAKAPVLLKRSESDADTIGFARRKSKSIGNASSSSSSSKQSSGKKGWRNHRNFKNSEDAKFIFKEAGTEESSSSSSTSSRDSRTTVMIKNIPNKYSQKLLLNMLDNHCIHCNEQIGEDEPFSAYDFVYLPIDFNNKCNVGYGFVNLTTPEATVRLYKAFHMQPWEVFNSRKICHVTYARLQGLESLKEHFKNSRFACDNDEYMPVVFSPARDGRRLTEPVPIGGRLPVGKRVMIGLERLQIDGGDSAADGGGGGASSTTTSTHAPSDHADGGDDDDHDEADVISSGPLSP